MVRAILVAAAGLEAAVLGASGDPFSAAHTGTFVVTVIRFLLSSASASTIALLHFLFRKASHLVVYGILGILYLRALQNAPPRERGDEVRATTTSLWISLAICLLVASVDEIQQSFVPSRTGTWHDVVLDMAGAAMFQIIALGLMRRSRR